MMRRPWHRTPLGAVAAAFIGPAAIIGLSAIPHGQRPVLSTHTTLYCPAPQELIWNPRTQTAHCDPPEPDDFGG